MHRFFSENIDTKNIVLSYEDINHIVNVLRLKLHDNIIVCDGCGNDYNCQIIELSKKHITLNMIAHLVNFNEPKIRVTLFQGLPKSDKMELIIQKCVELGIHSIIPVETNRSIAKIKDDGHKKQARWQSIALAAAKQAQRGKIPQIGPVISFKEAVRQTGNFDISLIPYEGELINTLKLAMSNPDRPKIYEAAIFIGPEGGFEESEIILAKESGIIPITLGGRILRTETAGFAALTMLLYELGEYDVRTLF